MLIACFLMCEGQEEAVNTVRADNLEKQNGRRCLTSCTNITQHSVDRTNWESVPNADKK